ncbi:hypothetical protein PAPYR_8127 [Paratrimastix pyriformis]|uniref:Uncharacterized protein n=1 Tax=Paratrimastix pyriformis TaxID=342808 RepID=A0ABQ8UB90_9EUKA|nr:hypothetical protein PAPYR_8127 [Paratrimastix pyriformis]
MLGWPRSSMEGSSSDHEATSAEEAARLESLARTDPLTDRELLEQCGAGEDEEDRGPAAWARLDGAASETESTPPRTAFPPPAPNVTVSPGRRLRQGTPTIPAAANRTPRDRHRQRRTQEMGADRTPEPEACSDPESPARQNKRMGALTGRSAAGAGGPFEASMQHSPPGRPFRRSSAHKLRKPPPEGTLPPRWDEKRSALEQMIFVLRRDLGYLSRLGLALCGLSESAAPSLAESNEAPPEESLTPLPSPPSRLHDPLACLHSPSAPQATPPRPHHRRRNPEHDSFSLSQMVSVAIQMGPEGLGPMAAPLVGMPEKPGSIPTRPLWQSRGKLRGALAARTLARVLMEDVFGPHAVREDEALRLVGALADAQAERSLNDAEFFEGQTLLWQCVARFLKRGQFRMFLREVFAEPLAALLNQRDPTKRTRVPSPLAPNRHAAAIPSPPAYPDTTSLLSETVSITTPEADHHHNLRPPSSAASWQQQEQHEEEEEGGLEGYRSATEAMEERQARNAEALMLGAQRFLEAFMSVPVRVEPTTTIAKQFGVRAAPPHTTTAPPDDDATEAMEERQARNAEALMLGAQRFLEAFMSERALTRLPAGVLVLLSHITALSSQITALRRQQSRFLAGSLHAPPPNAPFIPSEINLSASSPPKFRKMQGWPSGPRRQFKVLVSSDAWAKRWDPTRVFGAVLFRAWILPALRDPACLFGLCV